MIQPLRAKNFASVFQKCVVCCAHPASVRGAYASSRTLSAGRDGRFGAADERRTKRTAKSCGPVPPTLGSTPGQEPGGRWLTSPVHRGEREAAVNTIAQGRPDCLR